MTCMRNVMLGTLSDSGNKKRGKVKAELVWRENQQIKRSERGGRVRGKKEIVCRPHDIPCYTFSLTKLIIQSLTTHARTDIPNKHVHTFSVEQSFEHEVQALTGGA